MNINVAILLFAVKKDTAVEMAKKREQERRRLEKLAETNRVSRYQRRSRSRSSSQSPRFFSCLFHIQVNFSLVNIAICMAVKYRCICPESHCSFFSVVQFIFPFPGD